MASIRSYRTSKGERRYEVRYRDGDGRQRSHAFTAHKDAQAFKLVIAELAGRTPRRAEMALALLKRILRSTEARGQVVDPVVFHVRVARPEEREPRFLTWHEAEEVRSWMSEHVSRIVPIGILTMLRRGELLGLRDSDVDFEHGAITIVSQTQDGRRTRTKTSAGRRTIDLGPAALKLLREQQLARAPNPDGLLFPARTGVAYEGHNFMNRVFKPAARAAGIPELTFHDLRHTGASLMIAAGCNVKVIAERMGHANGGALVLRRYGHLYKGAHRQAAIALESHVFAAQDNSGVGSMWDGAPTERGAE
jgi:integrase